MPGFPNVPIQHRLLLDEASAAALCGLEVEAFRSLRTGHLTVTIGKRQFWVRQDLADFVQSLLAATAVA